MNELKEACDKYLLALSSGEFDSDGDDWIEFASRIVNAALQQIYGEAIVEVEQALLNYAEYGALQKKPRSN